MNRSAGSRPARTTLTLDAEAERRAGECATCRHADIIRSSHGSTFYRCGLSDIDPKFRRYPVLPMHGCPGYAREGP